MKWIKTKSGHRIKGLNFLNSNIRYNLITKTYYWKEVHSFSLSSLKDIVETELYLRATEISKTSNLILEFHLEKGDKRDLKEISYSDWVGNTGNGIYIHNQEWKKYHWIFGRHLCTSSPYKEYAIRFDISIPKEKVIALGIKYLKRESRRFIKYVNNKK